MNHQTNKKPLDLLTLKQAAEIIGISPSILSFFVGVDSIPIIEKQDGVYFHKETVDRWKRGLETKPNRAIGERFKGDEKIRS
ncbi:MAG: hypothetical protein IJF84_08390 [Thermoguttaceae bacterium]|nr:hypothetical protein [Thermoguttaceae bacterium]